MRFLRQTILYKKGLCCFCLFVPAVRSIAGDVITSYQPEDIITYNSTINAASRSQLWPLALALLAFLHKKTFEADTVPWQRSVVGVE